jgi:2-oxoglutarate dehydrogenase E1 component
MNDPAPSESLSARWASSLLDGENASYLETLYEAYLHDPDSVEPRWRSYFDGLPRVNGLDGRDALHSEIRREFRDLATRGPCGPSFVAATGALENERKQISVLQLINAYRFRGHQRAATDPLGMREPLDIPELTLEHYGLGEADLDQVFNTGSLAGPDKATLREILAIVGQTYCGKVGAEYMHKTNTEQKRWIQRRLESVRSAPDFPLEFRRRILDRLTAAEGLERFLHAKYVGQKRFSLEGAESLIPLLDELVQRAGSEGAKEMVIGMAHRGRLNVLVNIMGKCPQDLFSEFEGRYRHGNGTGDVKYHLGFSSDIGTPGGPLHLALAFNPSHLEIVGPVVEGSVRARQERRSDLDGEEVIPVVIHGDAAFAGQGVVMETLNMSQTRGFSTKGTVHIVVNNQIGFTISTQQDARSTYYCTDVAKMVNAPIFHVNGDDPEAVVLVTEIALDYRMRFHKDVVIDLVCYRRLGHNEADEPAVTQPMMYERIKALPTTRTLYAERLVREGVVSEDEAEGLVRSCRERLDKGDSMVPDVIPPEEVDQTFLVDWRPYLGSDWDEPVETRVGLERLQGLAERLLSLPEDFTPHSRVKKIWDDRRKMAQGELPLDWGFAEYLAYASLVTEGHNVRLSGQDSGRGTFFHRHAVLHHQDRRESYVPLRHLADEQGNFLVIDSLLSEEAVLAFEYGFATADPRTLVIWEAQFGDFANGAQVVVDQFISSGEQKWGRLCGLVMLLPHGFEGQGPEHSSGRVERYLQLCAQHNMQVCMPTTPAQAFHLLRRQMVRRYRKPLIVMSPKSLLRHKLAVSHLDELTDGVFQPVIPEIEALEPEGVRRVVFCSGKVYYDLLEKRREVGKNDVAVVRVEQLYPFPDQGFQAAIEAYANATEFVWCQEEPLNQGAWYSSQHNMRRLLGSGRYLEHVTRPASASPAVGYYDVHVAQQREVVSRALGLEQSES